MSGSDVTINAYVMEHILPLFYLYKLFGVKLILYLAFNRTVRKSSRHSTAKNSMMTEIRKKERETVDKKKKDAPKKSSTGVSLQVQLLHSCFWWVLVFWKVRNGRTGGFPSCTTTPTVSSAIYCTKCVKYCFVCFLLVKSQIIFTRHLSGIPVITTVVKGFGRLSHFKSYLLPSPTNV